MEETVTDPLVGKLRDLFLPLQQGANVKRGLWLHGSRQSGSSWLAYHTAMALPDEMVRHSDRVTGAGLTERIKEQWRLDTLVRKYTDDSLLFDLYKVEAALEQMWNVDVLFLDDVNNIDIDFWGKHVMHRLDERVKHTGITVVAGNTSPTRFPSEWADGIAGLFHVFDMAVLRGTG